MNYLPCDHCGGLTDIQATEYRNEHNAVAWCGGCVQRDTEILNAGMLFKFSPMRGSTYWTYSGSISNIKSIPKLVNDPNQKCVECGIPLPHAKPNTRAASMCVSCSVLQTLEGSAQ